MDRVLWSLFDLLKKKYISSGSNLKALEFANLMQHLTLDIITSLSLSEPFGWITEDKDMYEYVKVGPQLCRGQIPWLTLSADNGGQCSHNEPHVCGAHPK
jgi:hypothetical protein